MLLLLMLASTFATAFAAGMITYGKQTDDIVQMQTRLKELGYYTNQIDGYFGDETALAIRNFQKANGLTQTGLADPETIEKMKSEEAIDKKAYIDSTRTLEYMEYTFELGDKGKQVKRLQTLLWEKGYLEGSVTEEFDESVQTAVCFFQLINNLPVTGVADGNMLSVLVSPISIDLNKYDRKITIAYGDTGSQVKMLQLELARLGYFTGDCSAKFGKNTQDAVYEFQKWNGLEQNGECGIDMRIMLAMGEALSYSEAIALDAVSALYEGDIAPAVETVKIQLSDLGFYTGLIDTEFTHELSEAVYFFQLANGIQTTGSADKATRLLLNSGECVTMDEFTVEMSEITVKRDDVGHQVLLLQRRLLDLGYYFESANGVFDKKTEEAVKLFQRAVGREETGIADTECRKIMNAEGALTYAEYVEQEEMQKAQEARKAMVEVIVNETMAFIGKPYEAGCAGKDSFGNAGLTYAVYRLVNAELHPTVSLQYESALDSAIWNGKPDAVSSGDQVFFFAGEDVLTGICVGSNAVVFASPEEGRVIYVENFTETEEYVFIGSIRHV